MTEQFNKHLHQENFKEAYELFLSLKKKKGKSAEMITLSKRLSGALRVKARDLANRKADREAVVLEKMLKEVIKFNGENFIGNK
ncbi:MAG: hypothetical protein ACI857_002372 [Arenicella sp.]